MKLLTGIVTGLLLGAAVPSFASDVSADREAVQKRGQATQGTASSDAQARKACACGVKRDRA